MVELDGHKFEEETGAEYSARLAKYYAARAKPASPPSVENSSLKSILGEIYARPGATGVEGDGKVGTAVKSEFATGQQVKGHWHINDAADQLSRLVKLLEDDRKAGGTILTPDERRIAMGEAKELLDALQGEDRTGNVARALGENPQRAQDVKAALTRAMRAPSLAEVTGSTFEEGYGGKPILKTPGRLGGFAGALSVAGDIFAVIEGMQTAHDTCGSDCSPADVAAAIMCAMLPGCGDYRNPYGVYGDAPYGTPGNRLNPYA